MIMWSRHILERLSGHPADERLALLALAPETDSYDAPLQAARTHAASCARCAERLARLVKVLDHTKAAAEAEADEHFMPSRLERQQSQILRRLGAGRMPARVIPFPAPPRPQSPVRRVARRWVAAAAAVGLFVGVVAGRLVGPQPVSVLQMVGHRAAPAAELGAPLGGEAGFTDEEFLVELEAVAFRPQIEPLRALDELTPRVTPLNGPR
jgi:hypothetical protein